MNQFAFTSICYTGNGLFSLSVIFKQNWLHALFYLGIVFFVAACSGMEVAPKTYVYSAPRELADGLAVGNAHDAGVDPARLERMINKILSGRYQRIDSVLVQKGQLLILEEYFNGKKNNTAHDIRSATKSITSLLVGIAIDRGFIKSVDDRVFDYLAFTTNDSRKKSITIKHLLTMSSGLDCNDWQSNSHGREGNMYQQEDWVAFTLGLEMVREPGEDFSYCTGGVVVLGKILQSATGKSVADFSREVLFTPLGIEAFDWKLDPAGNTDTGGHIHITPRAMLKIGKLVLNRGVYNGTRVVSSEWLSESMLNRHGFIGYGYLWWLRTFPLGGDLTRPVVTYLAIGNGEQSIYIVPEYDLVVVFTTSNYNRAAGETMHMMDRFILPAVMHK